VALDVRFFPAMQKLYEYLDSLLEERQRAMRTLHCQQMLSQITASEGASSLRAILKGIDELETLLTEMQKRRYEDRPELAVPARTHSRVRETD
jgi:hypothetical protein